MKILLPVDGSSFTKKALAFLVTHDNLLDAGSSVIVLNVQTAMPPRVKTMVGAAAIRDYHQDEAAKVLGPVQRFLQKHGVTVVARFVVGNAADEIVRASEKDKVHMIVMGTHGHGLLGRALMGSVAQRVVTDCTVPVLLVK
jgi:nucleotide-binding universal stress UspA family protein